MKQYNVRCPLCGALNHGVYLDETEGHIECDQCGKVVQPQIISRIAATAVLIRESSRTRTVVAK